MNAHHALPLTECVFVHIMCSSVLYETGYALQWYLDVGQVLCYRPQISLAKIR